MTCFKRHMILRCKKRCQILLDLDVFQVTRDYTLQEQVWGDVEDLLKTTTVIQTPDCPFQAEPCWNGRRKNNEKKQQRHITRLKRNDLLSPGGDRRGTRKRLAIYLERAREGHCQSDEHCNRFKGNVWENFWEMGRSAYGLFWAHRYHLGLNWTELKTAARVKQNG